MLVQATRATRYRNCHLVIDTYSDVIFMIKLIQETKVFKIQSGHSSTKGNEFVDLFAKRSVIINARILPKNYKKCVRRTWSQSKDGTNIFEVDENAGAKKTMRP